MSIFDTRSNPAAREKFQDTSETVGGYPATTRDNSTSILVADRFQVQLQSESGALTASDDGGYRIDNGPFMRRFLDSYYPMRVSQKIVLADTGLRFFGIRPEVQPGFAVEVSDESIDFDAWFEGRLLTAVELVPED